MPDHEHHADGPQHHVHFDTEAAATSAEQEADVLHGFLELAIARAREVAAEGGLEVRRVLDLGCGPGVGTVALARAFDPATVVAADGSGAMLARAADRIQREDVGDRVTTLAVDLPAELDALPHADLVWASMVLHHLGDEGAALRALRERLPVGGLIVLVERAGLVRVGDDAEGSAWPRLEAAWGRWFAGMRAALPGARPSEPYGAALEAAGFEVVVAEPIHARVDPPLPPEAQTFARRQLERALQELADELDPDDLRSLRSRLEPEVLAAQPIRATRDLYVARVVA